MSAEVATEILRQLGGIKKLALMVGAKGFTYSENNVSFRIGSGAKNGINAVRIVLNGKDLYDVSFMKIRGTTVKTVSLHEDVYNDMLKELFEKTTGFYLSMK